MKWNSSPIRIIAPLGTSEISHGENENLWQLTLDQIESNTGEIIAKKYGTVKGAGTSTFFFDEKNVLYSKLRPYLNKVICPEEQGIATSELVPLKPNSKLVDKKYLMYYLRSNHFLQFAKNSVAGAKMPRIIMKQFWEHSVPLPPPSEQRRIVEILDQADALRKKRAEADAKTSRILPALFYKMFGDPVSLMKSKLSIPLEMYELEIQNGFACGEKDVENGIPHLRMNNIDDSGYLNLNLVRTVPIDKDVEKYQLKNGDVLFMGTNSEEKIGKSCLFVSPDRQNYLFSNHLYRIRIEDSRISPSYLSNYLHFLWSKKFYPSIAKRWVNQASVSKTALSQIKIFKPDKKNLLRFNIAYQEFYQLREKRSVAIEKIESTYSTILFQAFSGKLTAKWRKAHMQELLQEMEQQAKYLEKS